MCLSDDTFIRCDVYRNKELSSLISIIYIFFQCPTCPCGLRGPPSWAWHGMAHEARLRCPDVVSGDIGGCSARRALKP